MRIKTGLYIPKGYGFITGLLYEFSNDYLYLSFEPRLSHYKIVKNDLPEKYGVFSVLNDTPKHQYLKETYQLNNTGIQIKLKNLIFSYGNWNLWWGPGIHNSLSLSNNSKGFYNYSLYLKENINVLKNTKFNFKYLLSSPFTNSNGQKYFLTSLKMKIINRNIEFGYSKDVLSGGYDQIVWRTEEAASVIFFNENMKYWDYLNSFYINYFSKTNGLNLFFEIGSPNRSFGNKEPRNYFGHNIGSNFGMRKYGIFNHENLMLGFEYTRLVQSSYYNILPSPNWYDNQKYNYSSFQGMRWASHSGSDSDDLLL